MSDSNSISLRPKQAAAFLGISPATLWRWTKERKDEGFPQPSRIGPRTTVFVEEQLASFRDKKRDAE